jgi:hypothetical protein
LVAERRRGPASDALIAVRLTHKYAESIDGIDLSQVDVGDRVQLPSREAALLTAEGWAVRCPHAVSSRRLEVSADDPRAGPQRARTPRGCDQQPFHTARLLNTGAGLDQHDPVQRSIQQPAAQTTI